MRHRSFLRAGLVAGAALLVTAAAPALLLSGSGPINGVAAAPGDFANCTACHTTNAVNSGDGSFAIGGAPAVYTPGQTYPLTITLQDPGQKRWGFELVALDDAGANAGLLASTGATVQTSTDAAGRIYAKHTNAGSFSGTANGPVSWTVNWTAPAAGRGTVAFYAAGNAANNNLSNSGDFIYTAATATGEFGVAPDATVVAQPDDPSVRRGATLAVRARVRNHLPVADNLIVVSRLKLPTGAFYPAVGWLLPPAQVALIPDGQQSVDLIHAVPLAAPLITARYDVMVGRAPSTLIGTDFFTLSILP